MQYLMPVTLRVDFTVTGKSNSPVFLPTEQLVAIGDFCFSILLRKGWKENITTNISLGHVCASFLQPKGS